MPIGPSNALAPYIGPGGLIVVIDPAVIISNNVLNVLPQTNVIVAPNTTNFIFYNAVSNAIQVNTSGFPSQVIPIATATTSMNGNMVLLDNRPDFTIISLPTALVNAPGTSLTTGNFSFSGWGTGASLVVNSGTQTGFSITITAGTSPSQRPTITLTFNTSYSNAPITIAQVNGGTGMVTDITAANTTTQSVMTYDGLPVNTKTYTIQVFTLGQ
jgi:hypothetical protein